MHPPIFVPATSFLLLLALASLAQAAPLPFAQQPAGQFLPDSAAPAPASMRSNVTASIATTTSASGVFDPSAPHLGVLLVVPAIASASTVVNVTSRSRRLPRAGGYGLGGDEEVRSNAFRIGAGLLQLGGGDGELADAPVAGAASPVLASSDGQAGDPSVTAASASSSSLKALSSDSTATPSPSSSTSAIALPTTTTTSSASTLSSPSPSSESSAPVSSQSAVPSSTAESTTRPHQRGSASSSSGALPSSTTATPSSSPSGAPTALPLNGLFTPGSHLFPYGVGVSVAAFVALSLVLIALLKCLCRRASPAHEDIFTVGVAPPPRRRSKLVCKELAYGKGDDGVTAPELAYGARIGAWARSIESHSEWEGASWDSHGSAPSYATHGYGQMNGPAPLSVATSSARPPVHPSYPLSLSQVLPPLPPVVPSRTSDWSPSRVGRSRTLGLSQPLVESPVPIARAATVAARGGVQMQY